MFQSVGSFLSFKADLFTTICIINLENTMCLRVKPAWDGSSIPIPSNLKLIQVHIFLGWVGNVYSH